MGVEYVKLQKLVQPESEPVIRFGLLIIIREIYDIELANNATVKYLVISSINLIGNTLDIVSLEWIIKFWYGAGIDSYYEFY